MITLVVNQEGFERKIETIAEKANDLTPAIRKFVAGHLRSEVRERYQAQNFAPLAPSTIQKRMAKGLRSVEKKLAGSVRKALTDPKVRAKTRARREALLVEFQVQHRRGRGMIGPQAPLTFKQMLGLGAKVDKAVAKAVSAPILGKLAQSLTVTSSAGRATLASRTKRGWSAVHNEGDGHVPKRETFKELSAEDVAVLVEILKEHLLVRDA